MISPVFLCAPGGKDSYRPCRAVRGGSWTIRVNFFSLRLLFASC